MFDLLIRADLLPDNTDALRVKSVTRELLATLKRGKLKFDWRKYQGTQAAVRVAIEQTLDDGLPEVCNATVLQQAADAVYAHFFGQYSRGSHDST